MKDQIIQILDDLHIKYRWTDHAAVFTVSDLANMHEDPNPVKNLLLQENNGGRKFLVVMAGNERLDLNVLRKKVESKRLIFANSETLMQTFGVTPGAVSIFGMIHDGSADVNVIVDKAIINIDAELGFHPNDNTATIFFSAHELIPILKKMGCSYTVMKLH